MNIIVPLKNQTSQFKSQAQVFKLLAHPARLEILESLRDGEQCVCHMEYVLGYRQAYLSQQLAVLREAGILQDRQEGWNHFYRVARPEIFTVIDAMQSLTGNTGVRELVKQAAVHCSCPKCSDFRK